MFFFVKNKNPIFESTPVVCCEKHRVAGREASPVFDLFGRKNTAEVVVEGKHLGFKWSVPEGNTESTLNLPLMFRCCSKDAVYATSYTMWGVDMLYTGQLCDFTILPTFNSIKVLNALAKEKVTIPPPHTEEEPTTPPETEILDLGLRELVNLTRDKLKGSSFQLEAEKARFAPTLLLDFRYFGAETKEERKKYATICFAKSVEECSMM